MKITRRSVILISIGVLCLATGAVKLYYHHVQERSSGRVQDLLDQADALAWNNRWAEATPIYGQAEALSLAQGDRAKALYAHVSQMIPGYESSSLPGSIHQTNAGPHQARSARSGDKASHPYDSWDD